MKEVVESKDAKKAGSRRRVTQREESVKVSLGRTHKRRGLALSSRDGDLDKHGTCNGRLFRYVRTGDFACWYRGPR